MHRQNLESMQRKASSKEPPQYQQLTCYHTGWKPEDHVMTSSKCQKKVSADFECCIFHKLSEINTFLEQGRQKIHQYQTSTKENINKVLQVTGK